MSHVSYRLLGQYALICISLLSATLPLLGQPSRGTVIDFPIVDELISNSLLATPTDEWIHSVLAPTLSRTSYRKVWSVNRFVKIGYLNFYFLKPKFKDEARLPPAVARYREALVDNCAYFGRHGVILCDTDFLRNFAYMHGLPPEGTYPTARELGYEGFLDARLDLVDMWILGHEIGHVINGDGEADLPSGEPLDVGSSNDATLEQLGTTKDREYAADLSFAKNLALDKKREGGMVSMLIDMVNAELVSRYGKPNVYYAPGFALDYAHNKIAYYFDNDPNTHPEYMVRAVRILQQIAATTKDVGLQALLASFSYKFKQATSHEKAGAFNDKSVQR
ncbi:MAG: hypothetical protein M3O31_15500 [Acidobacteriota bacterium]|nr:hypothetical protein [Acidobacteriota bacterium]